MASCHDPRELQCHKLANLVTRVGENLLECHPHDVLTLAGFLATNAIRCWPPECRIAVAKKWCATLMARLRESLD